QAIGGVALGIDRHVEDLKVVARVTELASRLREESHCRRTSLGAGRVPESERNDFPAIPREPELGPVRSVEREVRRRSRRVERAAPKALHASGVCAERDDEQRKQGESRRQRGSGSVHDQSAIRTGVMLLTNDSST